MAFSSQAVSSVADAVSKLNTFLSAQGWNTHHDAGAGEFAAWKNPSGSIWITCALQWNTGTPRYAGVYQWHGQAYDTTGSTGNVPYDQDDDSGNGFAGTANASLNGQRRIDFGSAPEHMFIFEDDNYFHVVVKTDTSFYAHFGAGYLVKNNDWTGGEYCYASIQDPVATSNVAVAVASTFLLDGLAADDVSSHNNMEERCATLHIEGMDEQTTQKWAVCMGNQASGNRGTARNGDSRIHILGGFRGGPFVTAFGQFAGTIQRGLVPMYPIVQFYWNRTTGNFQGPLGQMPDVRGINIKNYANEQEITVGGDTWVVFPSYRRKDESTSGANFTMRQGIAYKQVS